MVSHTHGTPEAQKKGRLDLRKDPKDDSITILKQKLLDVSEKLEKDPDNKKLKDIKHNLEQMFERERERGFC